MRGTDRDQANALRMRVAFSVLLTGRAGISVTVALGSVWIRRAVGRKAALLALAAFHGLQEIGREIRR
jgi:hypothetical protein